MQAFTFAGSETEPALSRHIALNSSRTMPRLCAGGGTALVATIKGWVERSDTHLLATCQLVAAAFSPALTEIRPAAKRLPLRAFLAQGAAAGTGPGMTASPTLIRLAAF